MKKVIKYMQGQALQYSDHRFAGSAYLNSPGKEPQQRSSRRNQGYRDNHVAHAQNRSSLPSAHAHTYPSHASGASGPNPIPGDVVRVQYAQDNILQSYDLYIPNPTPDVSKLHIAESPESGRSSPNEHSTPFASGTDSPVPKYWIIYVHGGYFRDPKVDSSSFHPTLSLLATNRSCSSSSLDLQSNFNDIRPHVAGYASINYRLSPNPAHPQDAESTPNYEMRKAVWPDHFNDVLRAIQHLQTKHGFGKRYLLVGHSVGATMTLLTALQDNTKSDIKIEKPLAVLGVCGIYDFPRLHKSYPNYEMMTRNAIPNESDWDKVVSPAKNSLSQYEKLWSKGQKRWVLLAHSHNDGLLDWVQVEEMAQVFDPDGKGEDHERRVSVSQSSTISEQQRQQSRDESLSGADGKDIFVDVIEVQGGHNEVWSQASELARVIADGVREMIGIDQE